MIVATQDSYIGSTAASQAAEAGSIPVACSTGQGPEPIPAPGLFICIKDCCEPKAERCAALGTAPLSFGLTANTTPCGSIDDANSVGNTDFAPLFPVIFCNSAIDRGKNG